MTQAETIPHQLLSWLRCPLDKEKLSAEGNRLSCPKGHDFFVRGGVPIMLLDHVSPTIAHCHRSLTHEPTAPVHSQEGEIDPYVQDNIAATCGFMYLDLIGKVRRYPLQHLAMQPHTAGDFLLDIGCNWGRWSISAAQNGFIPIGIDPQIEAVMAARRITNQMGLEAYFVVADGRHLPFADGFFQAIHSYAVLQHFAKEDAKASLEEAGRVLSVDGQALIQMPHKFGPRAIMIQALRGFRTPVASDSFELRYWTRQELREAFQETLGEPQIEFDGFFFTSAGRDVPPELPFHFRFLLHLSRLLGRLPLINRFADSFYLRVKR